MITKQTRRMSRYQQQSSLGYRTIGEQYKIIFALLFILYIYLYFIFIYIIYII